MEDRRLQLEAPSLLPDEENGEEPPQKKYKKRIANGIGRGNQETSDLECWPSHPCLCDPKFTFHCPASILTLQSLILMSVSLLYSQV